MIKDTVASATSGLAFRNARESPMPTAPIPAILGMRMPRVTSDVVLWASQVDITAEQNLSN